jgi:hypothetical protein
VRNSLLATVLAIIGTYSKSRGILFFVGDDRDTHGFIDDN